MYIMFVISDVVLVLKCSMQRYMEWLLDKEYMLSKNW